jgi:hypothetical protein
VNIAAIDLVIRVARATTGASELPPGSNRGPYVERVLKLVGLGPGKPWCAAQVANVGIGALGEHWPLPRTGGCQELHDWAHTRGLLASTPSRGDVFLVWHTELGRFAHTGLVLEVQPDGSCTTHEGNTSRGGSREGWIAAERVRRFKPADRFIQWTSLVEDAA